MDWTDRRTGIRVDPIRRLGERKNGLVQSSGWENWNKAPGNQTAPEEKWREAMIANYMECVAKLYDHLDALIIINHEGIVEYSIMLCASGLENEGFTGKHILDVYPNLTEQTSSHCRVMKSGRPIFNETQTVKDMNGNVYVLENSTYPIEYHNEIIGTVEGSVLLSKNGKAVLHTEKKEKKEVGLHSLDQMITEDPVMLDIKEKVKKIAPTDSPVLIYGETGTGKELIAQAIHHYSRRCGGPFISQNCSAIPSSLLESILFGTVKGSYTGAENRKGLFELAHGGTLFLDELNSMDMAMQAKILKAIEDGRIRRLGAEKETEVSVRVVSAVNEDPFQSISAGTLRRDLYFRLGVIQINLPPLRNRRGDIAILTEFFIGQYNEKMGKHISSVSNFIWNTFHHYDWPGNVRELKNAIEYAFHLASGDVLTLKDIPEHILFDFKAREEYMDGESALEKTMAKQVAELEKKLIADALSTSKNVTAAAKKLGITRQTLQYKMEKYNCQGEGTARR